jgi:hypothetical protein
MDECQRLAVGSWRLAVGRLPDFHTCHIKKTPNQIIPR